MHDAKSVGAESDVYSLAMTTLFVLRGEELPLDVIRSADRVIEGLDCGPSLKRALRDGTAWEVENRISSIRELCGRIQRAMTEPAGPLQVAEPPLVCILADSEDRGAEEELRRHLSPLIRRGMLRVWSQWDMVVGELAADAFNRAIDASRLVLCLVSSDFLANGVMGELASRAMSRRMPVVPVILKATFLEGSDLARLETFPHNRRPITSVPDRDEQWALLVREVSTFLAKDAMSTPADRELVSVGHFDAPMAVLGAKESIDGFIVASSDDDSLSRELSKHFGARAWLRNRRFQTTADAEPGTDRRQWIRERMSEADVVLILLSASFFGDEGLGIGVLEHAQTLQTSRKAQVWLVVARSVSFDGMDFAFNVLPPGGRPITSNPDRDTAWAEVTRIVFQHMGERAHPTEDSRDQALSNQPRGALFGKRTPADGPIRLAVLYAPEDMEYVSRFEAHATPLVRRDMITLQRNPTRGVSTKGGSLERADLIVWFASADLFADYDEIEHELKSGVERVRAGKQKMLLVRLRPCDIQGPINSLPSLPDDTSFVTMASDVDEAWVRVWWGIRDFCGLS